jgi:hypothetical protein
VHFETDIRQQADFRRAQNPISIEGGNGSGAGPDLKLALFAGL